MHAHHYTLHWIHSSVHCTVNRPDFLFQTQFSRFSNVSTRSTPSHRVCLCDHALLDFSSNSRLMSSTETETQPWDLDYIQPNHFLHSFEEVSTTLLWLKSKKQVLMIFLHINLFLLNRIEYIV